jgi:hypothetical protein
MRSIRIFSGLAALLLFSSIVQAARAQNDPAFTLATQPYESYNPGSVDKVDNFSGNLSFDIPLISYPQKGGKLKLGFSIHYQSGPAFVEYFCDYSQQPKYCWNVPYPISMELPSSKTASLRRPRQPSTAPRAISSARR